MVINIIQWNARSANSNKAPLERILQEHKISVALISETWYKPDQITPKFSGYNVIMKNRADGKGGCAILIKNNLSHTIKKISYSHKHSIQICAATIKTCNTDITVVSVYCKPSHKLPTNFWLSIFQQINSPVLIGGDFNCHHYLWGCRVNDYEGRSLLDALEDVNYIVLNDGSPTLITAPNQNPSAVDLTLCSPDITTKTHWQTLNDGYGSNHFPILIKLNEQTNPKIIINPRCRWNLKNVDWSTYSVLNSVEANKFQLTDNHLTDYDNFINIINSSATRSIPQNLPKTIDPFKSKIWWDDECYRMEKQRKKAFDNYKRIKSYENFIECLQLGAKSKKLYKLKKRNTWRDFVCSLNKDTPSSQIWSKIKTIDRGINPSPNNKVTPNQSILRDFLCRLSPDTVTPLLTTTPIIKDESIDNPFTLDELEYAIKNSKNSSPGSDQIRYPMLKNLPISMKLILLNIFNRIYNSGVTIPDWNSQLIIPILKPGKNPENCQSYRPIALSSCVGKTYERMLKLRLEWWIESRNILPNYFFGFRRGMSCSDNLTVLTTDIYKCFTNNNYISAIFLDIQGAYDNVCINILKEKLTNINLPTKMLNSIISLTWQRKISLIQGNTIIDSRLVAQGLPQGGVLSPILFNLYIHNLKDLIISLNDQGDQFANNFNLLGYADDIVMYIERKTLDSCINDISLPINSMNNILQEHGLSLSESKTTVSFFTRHNLPPLPAKIKFDKLNLNFNPAVKYLGMTLDQKLTFKYHLSTIIKKCESNINLLRVINYKTWGASPEISLRFYNVKIRSIIDYGSIVYGSTKTYLLEKLNKLQFKSLRCCISALRSTPTHSLLVECSEFPLHIRRKFMADKFLIKRITIANHPLNKKLVSLSSDCLTKRYWNNKEPPLLVNSFIKYSNSNINVHKSPTQTCYQYPYVYSINNPQFKPNFTYNCSHPTEIIDKIQKFFHDPISIYTDGSKIEGRRTGFAIYDVSTKNYKMYKVPDNISIFHAELLAIYEALNHLSDNQILNKNVVIASDSLSAIQKLKNPGLSNHDPLIYKIIDDVYTLKSTNNLNINIVWVKAHVGNIYNELVDQIAKKATVEGNYRAPDAFPEEYISSEKESNKIDWQYQFSQISALKGTYYFNLNKKITKKPWFFSLKLSRASITKICRMRFNHTATPVHLKRFNIIDDDHCLYCGDESCDPNHLILGCHRFDMHRKSLYDAIIKNKISLPTNLNLLLKNCSNDIYTELAAYMDSTKIHL